MKRRQHVPTTISRISMKRGWPMICVWLLGLVSPCFSLQTGQLKQTRDPYFNPREQMPTTLDAPRADGKIGNPLFQTRLAPIPSEVKPPTTKPSSVIKQPDPSQIKQLPVWVPPAPKRQSPVNAGAMVPDRQINSAANKQAPAAQQGTLATEKKTDPAFDTVMAKQPRKIVGDFSADLSQLKRGSVAAKNIDQALSQTDSNHFQPGASAPLSTFGNNGELPRTQQDSSDFVPSPALKSIGSQLASDRSANDFQLTPSPREENSAIEKSVGAVQPSSVSATADRFDLAAARAVPPQSAVGRISSVIANQQSPPALAGPIDNADELEPTRLMAMVGNEPIFVGDMLFELNQMIERYLAGAPEEIKKRERSNGLKMLLTKYIDSKLLYIDTIRKLPEGAEIDKIIEQASKEFDKTAAPAMMKQARIESLADFDAHLRMQGSSLRMLRLSWSKDQLTRYFMSQELEVDKQEATHRELLEEYQKNLDQYAIPAKARWEQIMVRFDRTESREEAERLLVEMGNKIVHGANFASVAKKGSHGYTASKGGLHDWIGQGELAARELDQAIFSIEVGKLSDKIETADGFHIIRVLERTEATRTPFVDAQVQIKERILEKKRAAVFEEHLKKLRLEIPVVRYDQAGPASPIRVAERNE